MKYQRGFKKKDLEKNLKKSLKLIKRAKYLINIYNDSIYEIDKKLKEENMKSKDLTDREMELFKKIEETVNSDSFLAKYISWRE